MTIHTIAYTKFYTVDLDDEQLFQAFVEALYDPFHIAWNEESFEKLKHEFGTEGPEDWQALKDLFETNFYANYPPDEVHVEFPLKGDVEELTRLWAYDIDQSAYEPTDVFDGAKSKESWVVAEDGSEIRGIDLNAE